MFGAVDRRCETCGRGIQWDYGGSPVTLRGRMFCNERFYERNFPRRFTRVREEEAAWDSVITFVDSRGCLQMEGSSNLLSNSLAKKKKAPVFDPTKHPVLYSDEGMGICCTIFVDFSVEHHVRQFYTNFCLLFLQQQFVGATGRADSGAGKRHGLLGSGVRYSTWGNGEGK